MADRLKGKVALVTGARSMGPGCGNDKTTAVLFAREGARIFGVDITLEAVEEHRGIIEQEEGQCEIYEADVYDSAQVRATVVFEI